MQAPSAELHTKEASQLSPAPLQVFTERHCRQFLGHSKI